MIIMIFERYKQQQHQKLLENYTQKELNKENLFSFTWILSFHWMKKALKYRLS